MVFPLKLGFSAEEHAKGKKGKIDEAELMMEKVCLSLKVAFL